MPTKRTVVAIGGNAITRPNQVGTIPEQYANAEQTCRDLLPLVEESYDVVLTHGNGPQVGNILLRVELSQHQVYPLPLDVCVSDSQGGMGYMLQQVMQNVLRERGISKPVATMLTQVVVDAGDPAFLEPNKPIGPFYTPERARAMMAEKGWNMIEDAGRGFRRVVPSPRPLEIVEIEVIRKLVDGGVLVVTAGGGGIPVVRTGGRLSGVEAVIDKDLTSALVASQIGADVLIIGTSVERVFLDFNQPTERPLDRLTLREAEAYLREGQFPPGSMGPKIEAAIHYLSEGGGEVVITDIASIGRALRGQTGTRIVA
jgi:carbamate kinase